MPLIVVDTNVLVFGLKKETEQGQTHMVERTIQWLDSLTKEKDVKVIVPATVLSELLVKCNDVQRVEFTSAISARFHIVAFDAPTALSCARMIETIHAHQESKAIFDAGYSKRWVTPDCQILTTAQQVRADYLVSHDKSMRKLAALAYPAINAIDIPRIEYQESMEYHST